MPTRHNHVTRDIRPQGQCPACDVYHAWAAKNESDNDKTRLPAKKYVGAPHDHVNPDGSEQTPAKPKKKPVPKNVSG